MSASISIVSGFFVLAFWVFLFFFFFQAEDGIRDSSVTGVQTCALPICNRRIPVIEDSGYGAGFSALGVRQPGEECIERVAARVLDGDGAKSGPHAGINVGQRGSGLCGERIVNRRGVFGSWQWLLARGGYGAHR